MRGKGTSLNGITLRVSSKAPLHYYAGTQGSASTPLAASQIVTGTDAQISANMVNSFTTILENGVQIALIKQPCMISLPSLWML